MKRNQGQPKEVPWYVSTPTYECVEAILDDGSGPSYEINDKVVVWAENKNLAKARGIRQLREQFPKGYISLDKAISPFAGLIVYRADICDECACKMEQGNFEIWEGNPLLIQTNCKDMACYCHGGLEDFYPLESQLLKFQHSVLSATKEKAMIVKPDLSKNECDFERTLVLKPRAEEKLPIYSDKHWREDYNLFVWIPENNFKKERKQAYIFSGKIDDRAECGFWTPVSQIVLPSLVGVVSVSGVIVSEHSLDNCLIRNKCCPVETGVKIEYKDGSQILIPGHLLQTEVSLPPLSSVVSTSEMTMTISGILSHHATLGCALGNLNETQKWIYCPNKLDGSDDMMNQIISHPQRITTLRLPLFTRIDRIVREILLESCYSRRVEDILY